NYSWTALTGCTAAVDVLTCVPTKVGTLFGRGVRYDSAGKTTPAVNQVIVEPSLHVGIQNSTGPGCGAFQINFTAQPSGGLRPYAVNWTLPGGANTVGLSAQHFFAAVGNYSVSATVTDATGANATALTYVLITACTGGVGPNSNGFPLIPVLGILVVALAAIVAVAYLMRRRGPPPGEEGGDEAQAMEAEEAPSEGSA